jgi:DNA-binding response OmpR family regulator
MVHYTFVTRGRVHLLLAPRAARSDQRSEPAEFALVLFVCSGTVPRGPRGPCRTVSRQPGASSAFARRGRGLARPLYAARAPVRILLTDHDGTQATVLAGLLARSGFRVTLAVIGEGATVEDLAGFEAIVLGPQRPLEERTEHCRQLREQGYPGGVLAVCLDATEGEALLGAGADDFATMPLNAIELATRIGACVRRASGRASLRWGGFELDMVHRLLRLRRGSIALTACECDLLACLFEAGGRPVSRAALRERVSHTKGGRGSNLVEVHLSRLRDKLGQDAALIETVRRTGYRLRR